MFCWARRSFGGDPPPSMSYERNRIYESAFTYNTERQFRNDYNFFADEVRDINTSSLNPDIPTLSKILELFFLLLSGALVLFTLPFSLFFCVKFIGPYERLVVMRLGHSHGVKGPGTVFVFPVVDTAVRIDIRIQSFELPAFQVITVDRALVEVAIVVFSRIVDPLVAHCGLQNREQTMRSLSYNITYNNLIKRTLADLTDSNTLASIFEKARIEFNQFCQNMGLEVTQIAIHRLRVVKPAENQAVSIFNTIMKSELGEQLIRGLGPSLKAFISNNSSTTMANTDDEKNMENGDNNERRESNDNAESTMEFNKMVCSLSPLLQSTNFVADANNFLAVDGTQDASNFVDDAEETIGNFENLPINDSQIAELVERVRVCCDDKLAAKVNRRYLIHVFTDYEKAHNDDGSEFCKQECDEEDSTANNYVNIASERCRSTDAVEASYMGALILDLRMTKSSKHDYKNACHWFDVSSAEGLRTQKFAGVVQFALRKSALLALSKGAVAPLSAYLNGAVEIVAGTVADALPLRFLAERASKLD